MKAWIVAARLKTLPLAVSGILLGSAIAYLHAGLQIDVLLLGICTAVFLQILSNYANDYGDYISGTDVRAGRADRALASGKLSVRQMQTALIILSFLCFGSGVGLLFSANKVFGLAWAGMMFLGFAAIAAAIKYTVGKGAYAYRGLGDLFVFIFFGLVAVPGIVFLHVGSIPVESWFAGSGMGLLSAAVLNVNNIRDIESDKSSGKITIPVRLGYQKAFRYHLWLLWPGILCIIAAFLLHLRHSFTGVFWMEYFLAAAVFAPAMLAIRAHQGRLEDLDQNNRPGFDKELKNLALSVLLVVVIFWVIAFFFTA